MNEQRPRQVTVAGWLIIFGGIAVVVTAYRQMASLHSLATRESIQSVVTDPAVRGSGLSVGDILTLMHVLALVAAACATASAVLGWHALKGSRSARIVLSVLAVPLLVAGLGGGGLFSTMVAVAALLLWMPPASQWFSGEPVEAPPASPPPASPPAAPPRPVDPPVAPTPPPGGWPPPQPMYWPQQQTPWVQQQPWASQLPPRPQHRPGGVVASVILTWVFGVLAALAMVGTLAYALGDRAGLWRTALQQNPNLRAEGMTQGGLVAAVCVVVGLVVIWCVAAMVVAAFAWRGAAWARVTLIVLVSVSLPLLVLAAAVNLLFVVPAAAAVVTIVLLARPEARAWCQPRR